jgi:hypothetical protein
MDKWEYQVVNAPSNMDSTDEVRTQSLLTALGEQGWELVGVINDTASWGNGKPITTHVILILKRRKP